MKIKTKLYIIAGMMSMAIILSLGVYIGFQSFTDKILSEQGELAKLNDLMVKQNIILYKLVASNSPFLSSVEELNENIRQTQEAHNIIKNLKAIINLDRELKDAIESIGRIDEYMEYSRKELFEAIDKLKTDFKNEENYSLTNVEVYKSKENYNLIYFDVAVLKNKITGVVMVLDTSQNVIFQQNKIINEAVLKYKKMASIISIASVIFCILLSVSLFFIITRGITSSIKALSDSLSTMSKGDFTNEIKMKTRDELGLLGEKMNIFQSTLNDSLSIIKEASDINEDANINLIESSADSSTSAVQISANIDSINNQVSNLDDLIDVSKKESHAISDFTIELSNYITEQMAMVEESTAAITQMIASIASISDLINNNSKVMKQLEITAHEGDNKLSITTDMIDEINSTVNEINDMSDVIKSISEQTNLLAMNAAIEAAHAGDAGKGFAVVADEIRKLAEASSSNSNEISQNLGDITAKFEKASQSGQRTRDAFTEINNFIKNVVKSFDIISSSTTELNTGGSQILEAMESLKDISVSVKDKSDNMKDRANNVTDVTNNVSDISNNVTNAISELNIAFESVKNSILGLKNISDKVGSVSEQILVEINKFKTK